MGSNPSKKLTGFAPAKVAPLPVAAVPELVSGPKEKQAEGSTALLDVPDSPVIDGTTLVDRVLSSVRIKERVRTSESIGRRLSFDPAWALERILAHPIGLQLFAKVCLQEKIEQALFCWTEIQAFQQLTTDEARRFACSELFERYIKLGAMISPELEIVNDALRPRVQVTHTAFYY